MWGAAVVQCGTIHSHGRAFTWGYQQGGDGALQYHGAFRKGSGGQATARDESAVAMAAELA